MKAGSVKRHSGVCDASAAVFLKRGETRFLLADDEDQHQTKLRIYDAAESGGPLEEFGLDNQILQPDAEEPEIDLEGSAWSGDRIFWIGSHSRSRKGKRRPSRHRLFATEFVDGVPRIVGKPYCTLLDDLSLELKLELDPKLPPKEGGVSIEGLSGTPTEGELLIGFRSPLIKGKALLIILKNAGAVIDTGDAPIFGEPIYLDLDGLGIRSIDYWPERKSYLLLAGSAGDNKNIFRLMRWSGPLATKPEVLDGLQFECLNVDEAACPEALLIEPESETVYVLFDEGNRMVNGEKCKDSDEQSFHSIALHGL